MTQPRLTAYERTEIEMERIVPLLHDLQEILGEEVVLEALRERVRRRVEAARASARTDIPFDKRLAAIVREFGRFAEGDVLEYAVRETENGLAVDVTDCRFAELMDRLDARDLGHLLLCSNDEVAVAAAGTRLDRSQTRMECASHCDFRFCDASASLERPAD